MFSLPYTRFNYLKDFLIEQKEDEVREKYILQAFNAWLQGSGQKKNFKQYIKHLGLEKKKSKQEQELSKEEAKRIVERNIQNAKNILMLDRKARQRKEG